MLLNSRSSAALHSSSNVPDIRRGEVAARTATDGRFYAPSVGRRPIGETPPGAGCVLQFGDDDRPVDDLHCGIIHAVCAQDFKSIHMQVLVFCELGLKFRKMFFDLITE